jgi:hypothetical protein
MSRLTGSGLAVAAVNAGQVLTKEQERELHDNYEKLYYETMEVLRHEGHTKPYLYEYMHDRKHLNIYHILEEQILKPLPKNAVKIMINNINYTSGIIDTPGMILDFQIKYAHGFNPKADKGERYIKALIYVKELWPHDFGIISPNPPYTGTESSNPYLDTFEGAYEFEMVKFDYYLDELISPFCDLVLMSYFGRQIQKINKFIKDHKLKANQLPIILNFFFARFTFFVKEYPYEPERLRRILTSA